MAEQEPVAWSIVTGNRIRVIGIDRDSVAEEVGSDDRIMPLYGSPTLAQGQRPLGFGFEDYVDEHGAIEEQLKSLGLPLPDCCCMPTTDELSAVMVDQIERLRTQVQLLTDEVERLRLTDRERVAVMWAIASLETDPEQDAGQNKEAAEILREMLMRTAAPINRKPQ